MASKPRDLWLRGAAQRLVRQVGECDLKKLHINPPLEYIPSTIAARPTSDFARTEIHRPSSGQQIFGNLTTGLPTADNDNRARRQCPRVAVFGCMQLRNIVRY